MPYLPKRRCVYPGCSVKSAGLYCPAHQRQNDRRYNQYRDPDIKRQYGRHWEKVRDLYIARHPLCEDCEAEGKLVPAAHVHHILPLTEGGTHAEENLRALCLPCHSKITMQATRDKGML